MSARHILKRHRISVPVERTLITPETRERKIVTNPTTGKFEVQHVVTPAVYKQGKAAGSTINRNARKRSKK